MMEEASPLGAPRPGSRTATVVKDPVSAKLRKELQDELEQQGLLVWLDSDRNYTAFVDDLVAQHEQGAFPYPVVAFRGSYLELMLALEKHGNQLRPDRVLIHMPGFNEESIKQTPQLEMYRAGKRFRKRLSTLIEEAAQGKALPEDVTAFLESSEVTLERADDWLCGLMQDTKDPLSTYLRGSSAETILRDLITDRSQLARLLPDADKLAGQGEQVFDALRSHLGIDAAWRAFITGAAALDRLHLSELAMTWLMAVEFVHDLLDEPWTPELTPLKKLAPSNVRECRRLVELLRAHYTDTYAEAADLFERRLGEEAHQHQPNQLGSIDTFRWEEQTVRLGALDALAQGDWKTAATFADERTPEKCFWVRDNQDAQHCWELITLAAETGIALQAHAKGLARCASLEEATDRYQQRLHLVDRAHRHFEQRAHTLLRAEVVDYERLLAGQLTLRKAYRVWADNLAREFNQLCETYGPLPSRDYQQRALYNDVVHEQLGAGQRVAYFLVDAMRFELASELAEIFKAKKFQVQLRARLAELPTVTEIGMNALAPVAAEGKLRPVLTKNGFGGFRSGESTVKDPPDRIKAMSTRSLRSMAVDLELNELEGMDRDKLKKRLSGKANLIVVRSLEFDSAGEKGLHLSTFEQTIRQVRDAVHLLASAGVEQFVLTADHGFLLQDRDTTDNLDFGANKLQPQRRHALSDQPSGRADALDVKLSALGYQVDSERYLAFCRYTALWKTREKVAPFVHGGNSLQERVIPVLLLERRSRRGKITTSYEVVAKAEPAELGRQRLTVRVRLQEQNTASLNFHAPKRISLALRVFERPDVVTRIVRVGPPGQFESGAVMVPPNGEPATVEFELEGGEDDERVRVEIFHPDGTESVKPEVVEGFFQSFRNRRATKPKQAEDSTEQADGVADPERGAAVEGANTRVQQPSEPPAKPSPASTKEPSWADLVENERYRKVLAILEAGTMVNEAELMNYLGNARQVRLFALRYEEVTARLPFDVEISTVNGLKTYKKKD